MARTNLGDIRIVWCESEVPRPTIFNYPPSRNSNTHASWTRTSFERASADGSGACTMIREVQRNWARGARTHCSLFVTICVHGPPLGRNIVRDSPRAPSEGPVSLWYPRRRKLCSPLSPSRRNHERWTLYVSVQQPETKYTKRQSRTHIIPTVVSLSVSTIPAQSAPRTISEDAFPVMLNTAEGKSAGVVNSRKYSGNQIHRTYHYKAAPHFQRRPRAVPRPRMSDCVYILSFSPH